MRFLVLAAAVAVIGIASGSILNRPVRRIDDRNWRVDSESDDHITYVRRPTEEETQTPTNNVDCNQTTTVAPPSPYRRRSKSSSSKSRLDVRSGVESSGRRKGDTGNRSQAQGHGSDGDHVWKVTHRTDDHITYTRRSSSASNSASQGQGQLGDLRRLGGSGSDSVLARVVIPGKDDELTEEGILEGTHIQGSRHTGYPTNELVHPYVKKSKPTSQSETPSRTKSLKSGKRTGQRRHSTSAFISSSPPEVDADHPPRVGEELNGWVVVSKSKDHISWERAGSAAALRRTQAVTNIKTRNLRNESRLRSLKTSKDAQARRNRQKNQLIPNPEGELVEGFPRVFNTYSRAFYVNDRNIDGAGSIRTSLTDTSNWKVGDELAGWKVVSKDHRGIVWQRMPTQSPPLEGHGELINEEDFLEELNKKNNINEEESESSESDSSSESKSNEGDNEYHGPPGTWYLSKETKNSITWKRDNTPSDVVFEMNAYPRIGDIQSGWRVKSKAREHITWVRINGQNESVESNEQA